MEAPKLHLPNVQYLLNFLIAFVIMAAVVKWLVPETYKSWFRI